MKLWPGILGRSLACVVLAASGCRPADPLSTNPEVAVRQVRALTPKGTSENAAKKAFTARGFVVSRLSSDEALNHLVIATYSNATNMWQVGMIIID
jgi:hypothetical protein